IGGIATGIAGLLAGCAKIFFRSVEFDRAVIWVGSISYSLYLIHVPVGGRGLNFCKRVSEGPLYEFVILAFALSASLLDAMLLHRLIEAQSLMASRKIGTKRFGLFAEPFQAGRTQRNLG